MKVTVLLGCLIVGSLCSFTLDDWMGYKTKFAKFYNNSQQQALRMSNCEASYNYIQKQNDIGYHYILSLNSLSDLSQDEINSMLNVRVNETDLKATGEVIRVTSNLKAVLPESVDWRKRNKVTPVQDQGRCGACWAFATIATAESFIALTTNKLYKLSEEYLLECTNGSDCSGGYVGVAMDKILNGVPNNTVYPYKASMLTSGKPTSTAICTYQKLIKPEATVSRYVNITDQSLRTLLSSHPVVAHFKAQTNFASYSSGVYSCTPNTTVSELNHAVSVIGYDSDNNYLIKNSWNQWWGDDGFAYIDSVNDCGIKMIVYQFQQGWRMGVLWLLLVLGVGWAY